MYITEAIGKYNEEENTSYFIPAEGSYVAESDLNTSKQISHVREVFRRAANCEEGEGVVCIQSVSNSPNHTVKFIAYARALKVIRSAD